MNAFIILSFVSAGIIANLDSYVDGNPEWHKKDLYQIKWSDNNRNDSYDIGIDDAWILKNNGEKFPIASFKRYKDKMQNREELRIVSKVGFTLENIPMGQVYFYNEAIAVFLDGEEMLPLAKRFLEKHYYRAKPLYRLTFRFPDECSISKRGWTFFTYQDTQKGEVRVLGLHYQREPYAAIVTYGYKHPTGNSIIAHEYFHICVSDPKHQNDLLFGKGDERSFLRSFEQSR